MALRSEAGRGPCPWRRRRGPAVLVALPLLAGAAACGEVPDPGPDRIARAEASSPRPLEGASVVGDSACAACHADVARTFRQTNKHRSLSRFRAATAPERFEDGQAVQHEATNLHYEAFLRGDTLYQRESRVDSAGRVVHERVHAADYVIGSGNQTRSYLMDVGGHLTEMPLTWYAEQRRWDMSPGYEEANDRFDRKINVVCMTCHNAVPEHSAFTQNHYREVPGGIGCERCHGPGSLHVAAREGDTEPEAGVVDTTIVNPARLDRGPQLAVCQQCHLAGIMVFPEGEGPGTFRPGEPLARNRTVFVPRQQLTDPDWVGIDSHPLRLARSACYRESEMTCTTCHDPHQPAELLPEEHYRQACLGCHGSEEADRVPASGSHAGLCSRPDAATPEEAGSGECVACHMRRGGTSDVPHVTFTDHWIRKDPGPPRDPSLGRPAFEGPDPIDLVALQETGRSSHDLSARVSRTPLHALQEAAAYWDFYETMHRHPTYPSRVVRRARNGLEGGRVDHFEARVALGRALAEMDSLEAAERVLRETAAAHPDEAWGHFWLGAVLEERGRAAEAVGPLEEAVRIQPRFLEARVKLAEVLYRSGRRPEARDHLETVVREDSLRHPRAWFNLGVIRLESGEPEPALQAFGRASDLEPDFVDAHVQAGTLLLGAGRLDGAETAFRKALVAAPESVTALGSMAVLHLQQGDTTRARGLLERVLEVEPGNPQARGLLDRIGTGG